MDTRMREYRNVAGIRAHPKEKTMGNRHSLLKETALVTRIFQRFAIPGICAGLLWAGSLQMAAQGAGEPANSPSTKTAVEAAQSIVDAAVKTAKAGKKSVLIHFGASW